MIWALLAILGIPIWLILGALAAATISRRSFQKSEGVFPLRLHEASTGKYQRKAHARWVHDVLLVNKGLALARTTPYGVVSVVALGEPEEPIKGLGESVMLLDLRTDYGSQAVIAVPNASAEVAAGPFHTP